MTCLFRFRRSTHPAVLGSANQCEPGAVVVLLQVCIGINLQDWQLEQWLLLVTSLGTFDNCVL
jgi:hypothetical protein